MLAYKGLLMTDYIVVLDSYINEKGDLVESRMDESTGEVWSTIAGKPQDMEDPIPAIDISSITNRGIFEGIVRQKIGKRRYRLWVGPELLEIVVAKDLHPSVYSVFCFLGQNIGYNNMVYLSTEEICNGTDHNRFFLVNPRFFYLGYYPYRNVLVNEWILEAGRIGSS
jgi:hypothetical protein